MDMFTYNLNHFFIIMCDFADLLIVSTHKHVMMFTLTVHHLTIAPFYQFPVQSQLFTPKSLLFTPISRANWGSTRRTARGTKGGVTLCGYEASAASSMVLIGSEV